jgi:phosphohistidine phosphatase
VEHGSGAAARVARIGAASRATITSMMPATKQLFVLRHAKSSWDDPGLSDHDRPLAPRGRRATQLLAKHVRTHQIEPAQVLCSSALRTRETFEGVSPGGQLLIEPDLYSASGDEILARLRRVPDDTPSVMVIGHNPALQMLVLRLAGAGTGGEQRSPDAGRDPDGNLAEVRRKFPTGALATLTFEGSWHELAPGGATLVGLVRPKHLHE